jgi:hypothetical protein
MDIHRETNLHVPLLQRYNKPISEFQTIPNLQHTTTSKSQNPLRPITPLFQTPKSWPNPPKQPYSTAAPQKQNKANEKRHRNYTPPHLPTSDLLCILRFQKHKKPNLHVSNTVGTAGGSVKCMPTFSLAQSPDILNSNLSISPYNGPRVGSDVCTYA